MVSMLCHIEGQTHGVLGKHRRLCCGQPLTVDLNHRVSGGQEKQRQIGVEPASVTVCNIMFLCQQLGMATEEGAYSCDKMSDPAYKLPLHFRLAPLLQNMGKHAGHYGTLISTTTWNVCHVFINVALWENICTLTNCVFILYTDCKHSSHLDVHGPIPSVPATHSDFSEISRHFLQLEHEAIDMLDQFPGSLIQLKQVLATLVFPLDEGKVVPLIDPRSYMNALTVQELFRILAPHWNPLSPDLLGLLLEASGCSRAATMFVKFIDTRNSRGHLVLCVRQMPSLVDFRSVHSGPISHLQSLYHSLFSQLPKFQATSSWNTIRISVEIDKNSIHLSDYERITTALSGLFRMPKLAFVFSGLVRQPLVLSWLTIPEFSQCSKRMVTDISGERQLAQNKVTRIAVSNWFYQCPTIKVCYRLLDVKLQCNGVYGCILLP